VQADRAATLFTLAHRAGRKAELEHRAEVALWTTVISLVILSSACAEVRFTGSYTSGVKLEPLPLRSTVTVLISPELRKDREDEAQHLESVRSSLSEAVKSDLRSNGPLTPVGDDPEARLELTIKSFDYKETKLWIMMWMVAPIWLFAVPMHYSWAQLAIDVKLTSARGDVLFSRTQEWKCTHYEGIYYGHDDLAFGCPAKEILERTRDAISSGRSEILGRLERSRPSAEPKLASHSQAVSTSSPLPVGGGGPVVVALFPIRDMSQQFDTRVLDQLTEFSSTLVLQQLGFKIVPKEQLREQLLKTKSESFKACYDESCQIELGKALAASKSLSISLIRVGNRCAFNATIYDLKTEAAERAAAADTACDENALLDGVKNVVGQLRRGP
jgi:hypothetical protein